MSDDWIFYPCQMGDDRAFIFFDHGIKDSINDEALPFLLRVRIKFKKPREDGLSSQEEYEALCALEDDIQKVADAHGSLFVGRITGGGARHLHIFTSQPEALWKTEIKQAGARHGYVLDMAYEVDAEKDGYWKELFPGPDDWQLIMDMRVLENLEKHGDDHSRARTIDHVILIPGGVAQKQLTAWLTKQGYTIQSIEPTDAQTVKIEFTHEGTVELLEISAHSIALRRKAEELGGDYDGWGTTVCD